MKNDERLFVPYSNILFCEMDFSKEPFQTLVLMADMANTQRP